MTILKHTEDRRSVAFIAATFALQLWAVARPVDAWTPMMTAALALLTCIAFVINHNHIHVPVFRSAWMNNAFSVLISVAEGLSSRLMIVPHNLNHHVHGGTLEDWSHESAAGDGRWGAWRATRYVAVYWARMFAAFRDGTAPKLPARLARVERAEHAAIFAFTVFALVANPLAFAFVIFPAWLAGASFITLVNLAQHEGTEHDSLYSHSRNFVGRFDNWLFFNAGYHAAHHQRPALHWTLLPALHAELAPMIPERLKEASIPRYLAKEYVFGWKPAMKPVMLPVNA